MYIKKHDYSYLEGLYKELDEVKRERFLEILLKAGAERIHKEVKDISKITFLDNTSSQEAIEEKEIITKTMIKKAYKTAKEEKDYESK